MNIKCLFGFHKFIDESTICQGKGCIKRKKRKVVRTDVQIEQGAWDELRRDEIIGKALFDKK